MKIDMKKVMPQGELEVSTQFHALLVGVETKTLDDKAVNEVTIRGYLTNSQVADLYLNATEAKLVMVEVKRLPNGGQARVEAEL